MAGHCPDLTGRDVVISPFLASARNGVGGEQCGVNGAQLWALWELLVSPGLKFGELSRLLSIHQSTASNLLDKLEKRRLIRRERGGSDQRIVRLYLNPEGLEIINKAPKPAQGILMGALQHLPDNSLNELQNALGQVAARVKFKDESSALKPLSENQDQGNLASPAW
jgi:DNA-binding MarR family transcriptional regulator